MSHKHILSLCAFLLCIHAIYAQAHISTQAHEGPITALAPRMPDGSYFSAGSDGFVIHWTEGSSGEHYQLSELEIRLITVHPNGTDIAVYETDGYALHRVSVWNWETKVRKYAKRLTIPVTSLAYSARGSFLSVGTASVSGTLFFDSLRGNQIRKTRESTGIVSLFFSSQTEKSAATYSPSGTLRYYNLSNGTQKQELNTEASLEQPLFFAKSMLFAGVKNNTIYIADALSGRVVKQIRASSPLIYANSEEESLYYIETGNRSYAITEIKAVQGSPEDPMAGPAFSGIPASEKITAFTRLNAASILGTRTGSIYRIDNGSTDAVKITENRYDKVLDIAAFADTFYFLTADSVYRSSYQNRETERITANTNNYTGIETYDGTLILWSRNARVPVKQIAIDTQTETSLFTPANTLFTLKAFGSKLVYIEGNRTVKLYDLQTGQNSEIYSGTGIQDAILYNNQQMIIAKSAAGTPASPLISVDTVTKETVSIPVNGDIAYALSYDPQVMNAPVYYIGITVGEKGKNTCVYSYYPSRRTSSQLLQLADEDTSAFTYIYGTTLYTNIGKTRLRSYNTQSRRELQLNRSASLPQKIIRNRNYAAVLNRDGSISWYQQGGSTVLGNWYLSLEGDWFEF